MRFENPIGGVRSGMYCSAECWLMYPSRSFLWHKVWFTAYNLRNKLFSAQSVFLVLHLYYYPIVYLQVVSNMWFWVVVVSKLLIFCHSAREPICPPASSLWSPGILLCSRFSWERSKLACVALASFYLAWEANLYNYCHQFKPIQVAGFEYTWNTAPTVSATQMY